MHNRISFLSGPNRTAYLITVIGIALILVTDFRTPLGFAHGTLYTLCVLTAALSRNSRFVIGTAVFGISFTLLGATVSPPAFTSMIFVIANRVLSIFTIASTAYMALSAIRHLEEQQRVSADLRRIMAESAQRDALLKIAGEVAHLGGWAVSLPETLPGASDLSEYKVFWSEEVARIHGLPAGYSPGLAEALNFYAPHERERVRYGFRRCANEGIPFDEELQLDTADGRRVWVRSIGRPVYDDTGRITHVHGAFLDLTWEKQLTEVLFESQRRFQQLADAIPLIIWTSDPAGHVDFASKALSDYVGLDNQDLLPEQQWIHCMHEEDRPMQIESWLAAAQSATNYTSEFRLRAADGSYRWHLIHARPVKDNDGKVLKWYGTAVDVHEARVLQDELRQSEERLTYLARATTDAIWDWNPNSRELWWSDGMYTLFGYGRQVWQPTADYWAERIHPDDRARVVPGIQHAIKGDATDWQDEYRFMRNDGSYAHVIDRGFVIRDENGRAVRMVGGMSDVTASKNLEEQLQQTERLRAIGQLTGGVAHDFNNLLTVILGNTELLTLELEDNPRLHELASMTRDAADRGAQLTQRLLAFARRQALEPRVVNIRQLVNDMEGLLRRTLSANIEFELVHGAGLWLAQVDPSQLEGALLNLCLKARDAMPDGGRLTIETANMHLDDDYVLRNIDVMPGQYVMIAVSDTGSGVLPEHLDKVFDPFFTTKGIGKGTGLGLSMVYGFVKQSNGHIKMYSEPGQGTTVRMYLPRAAEREENRVDRATVKAEGGSEHILLVEDDDMVREFVEGQLRGLGYHVTTAPNADKALVVLKTDTRIDLLFTDVMMPGEMNGRQLAEAAIALRPGLKVLYTSGYTQNAIVHHGRLDPGVQLLSKPYRRQDLALKLRSVLNSE